MRGLRITAALLIAVLSAASAGVAEPTLVGVWLHANGRIKVEITPCGDPLCGEIVWFRWPNDAEGVPLVDLKNPDPALRNRPPLRQLAQKFGAAGLSDPREPFDHLSSENRLRFGGNAP